MRRCAQQPRWRALLGCALLVLSVALISGCGRQGGAQPTPTPHLSPQASPTSNPLAIAAIAVIEKSLDMYADLSLAASVVIANRTTEPDLPAYTGESPYPPLAYEVSALSLASRALRASDPRRASAYAAAARRIADYLVLHRDDNGDGKTGWGLPGAWDAFQDGTVNPPNTVYAFQTGLVCDALIDAYLVTGDMIYLQTAEDAVATYLLLTTTSVDAQCSDCRYVWYSADANDVGRLVKNTNVLMGSVLARLANVTGGGGYQRPAEQVYTAELYEILARANFYYLGYNDPRYARNLTKDAHLAAEIWAFDDMTRSLTPLGSPAARNGAESLSIMAAVFWQCGAACQADIGTNTGVRVACQLAPTITADRTLCEQAVRQSITAGARTLPPYAILGLLRYLTLFGYPG